MPQRGYWAVRWGDAERITSDPTDDEAAACRQCYGMVAENMRLCFLSSRKADVRSHSKRTARTQNPANWHDVPYDLLGHSDRLMRASRLGKTNQQGPQ